MYFRQVQLALSAGGLQLLPGRVRRGRHDLVVLHLKICRLLRLLLLPRAEEVLSSLNSSCGSSLHYAIYLVVWNQVIMKILRSVAAPFV